MAVLLYLILLETIPAEGARNDRRSMLIWGYQATKKQGRAV
jgi:hypothetical protein